MQVQRAFRAASYVFVAILAAGIAARADEFHLKDGSKIVGTIVGYEDGAFRVETSYGFAMVRKDSIAEIIPAEKKPSTDTAQPAPALKPAALAEPVPAPAPGSKPAVLPMPAPKPKPPTPPVVTAAPAAPAANATAAGTTSSAPSVPAAKYPSVAPPDIAAPLPAEEAATLAPQPAQEIVRGNLYINQTYGFQMYKPPAWQVMQNPQNELPNAIAALGTEDQTTLLVIGRDALNDSLQNQAVATEHAMHGVYENYRPLGFRQLTIGGVPAIEQRFYGSLDGKDWSVIVTTMARGKEVFTIVGMTSATSDLIQIQENVIAKAIASLQFISQ